MSAPPGQRRAPEVGTLQGSPRSFGGDTSTIAQTADDGRIPRCMVPAVVDGQPADVELDAGLTLADLHAAFVAGSEYYHAARVKVEAEIEARRLLLEQSAEWRASTAALAIEKGPHWAQAMADVIEQDDAESEVAS